MKMPTSRRDFLAAGLAAPASGALPPAQKDATPKLVYRPLGKTGHKVTRLGFGCMLASDPVVLERAADIGINYFDTARSYQSGNNERMVGAALKGRRDKVVLASKSGALTRDDALRDLDTSLRELGTDHLDIWYLHSKSKPEDITDDLLEAQRLARKAGKIRFAGVSLHFNMQDFIPYLVKRGETDVILAAYNFTMVPEVGPAIEAARRAGVGIVAMKAMAGGLARIKRGDRLYGQDPNALTKRLQAPGAMVSALKWVWKNEGVDTCIIGMTDFEELDENIQAMSAPFDNKDATVLAGYLDAIRPLYCRMCGACDGACPRALPVADILRHLTYAEGYGQFALARERFLELPAEVRQVRCSDCGSCRVDCPNGVDVRNRLIRAQELLA